ncbi:hypothetical protein Goarm_005848, partial [Gossypium armourianum]|nr:hypothetical protein [Gossypium armourianum]
IEADRVPNQEDNKNIKLVSDLIESTNSSWKTELVRGTFQSDVVEKILQIPLVETAHEDFQVWRGEPTGEFSVRSAYKLLHEPKLEAIKEKKLTLHSTGNIQQVFKRGRATVHFNAAFDHQSFRSASGLIVWNEEGEILTTQTVIHSGIANPFTVEAYAGL